MVRRFKIVNDKMQRGYHYALSAPMGRNFDPDFCPELTPKGFEPLHSRVGIRQDSQPRRRDSNLRIWESDPLHSLSRKRGFDAVRWSLANKVRPATFHRDAHVRMP